MNNVLVGGLSRGMASAIEQHLGGVDVHVAETGGQVLEWLASRSCQLLILGHDLPGVGASDVVRRLTEGAESARVPVLYCMGREAERTGARESMERLGVRSFLHYPFATDQLLEHVASLLKTRVAGHATDGSGSHGGTTQKLDPLAVNDPDSGNLEVESYAEAERLKAGISRRLDVLDQMAVSLLEARFEESVFVRARSEARNLGGLLTAYGRHEAARSASDIELLLDTEIADEVDALRLSELVVELRAELDRPIAASEPDGHGDARPLLLVLDAGAVMADNLSLEAQSRGLRFKAGQDGDEMRAILERDRPSVVLVDLDSAPDGADWLALIGEIVERAPLTPVLIATAIGSLANRVAVARSGGYALLRKPVAPTSALDAAISAIGRTQITGCRVLAVDDDAVALADLRERLDPFGIQLSTLHDARRFWETIEAQRPDVVLLGMNTRHYSGLELCRVLRGDERWIDMPVMILGDGSNPAATHLAALAGADDFISRPIFAGDVVTRIANRLQRRSVARDLAGTDPLTGLMTRNRGEAALQSLMRLARRYRKPFSLASINLDGLRDVNEVCGHAVGDAVLRLLGRLLRNSFRTEDVVVRWGGDQLVFGAFGLEKDDCVRRLRLVSERLRRDPFRGGEAEVQVTFSAGVSALFNEGMDMPALQHAAEDTLAYAKTLGRGWVLPAGWSPDRRTPTETVDVVLVDSDDALAGLLMHSLEQAGWSARRFRDADDVAAHLCGPYPLLRARVVLLEVELPGKDGFSVLRAMGRDDVLARTRVIMLTVRANEREVLKSFDMGAFDHVAKPFSVQVLMQRIRRAAQT